MLITPTTRWPTLRGRPTVEPCQSRGASAKRVSAHIGDHDEPALAGNGIGKPVGTWQTTVSRAPISPQGSPKEAILLMQKNVGVLRPCQEAKRALKDCLQTSDNSRLEVRTGLIWRVISDSAIHYCSFRSQLQ